ncbi:ABC transporter ATP-binding protein [Bacillus paralicheniformis]|uniref:SkfA peptide export ATP-binding protein SkfE n=1 Tax=Bacillus paralicheniformis TaxID=1648923 RepID=A0ABY3FSU8_9BACI|nr:ABC transporter ATP-binding protein [Bacillus paralicheniformis]KUL19544.1 ABC transporter ATP-binding protein [Bacillus licheniformis LMG 6934]MBG9881755.1 ABC transporter ATP-binding protein [Bacillus paralicheniformis]MBL7476010.1 ABC transporter ATP-binding protein [Bacillus paralicheniformis]MBX9436117.1 ABC transporter ATP-binding protein [Bacillus paralicheniformis]MCW4366655.1 ABC transporter ATP-binding protein [Bacillus paralicheniformis]
MSNVVNLTNVTKTFRQKTAVDQINFSIKKGEIVAILGPNGAGKTTTISMILGLLKPTAGNITLFGSMPHEKRVREKIGTMLQEVSVMPGLRAGEIIELVRSYYPKPLSFQKLRALTGLTDKDLKTQAEKLSGGQKRRLGFALALAGDPDLMIFDEPTVGMDITSRNRFWRTVQTLAEQGKTIIFSTHYLQEADDAAQRILLFKDGSIVADGTPLQIKSRISKHSVSFIVDPEQSLEKLYQHPEIKQIFRKNNRVYIDTANTDKILELIFAEKIGAYDIQIERGNLEEAFRQLTGKGDDVK